MQQSGCFWHVYPEILVGWWGSYDERVEYIRTEKPSDEQELHLRLFQPVKGQLPQEVVEAVKAYGETWNAYDEAVKARDEAENAYDKAGKAWFRLWKKSYNKAWKKALLDEAVNTYDKAWKAYLEARKTFVEALSNHKDEIEALHADECHPDCPWDGETIFSAA